MLHLKGLLKPVTRLHSKCSIFLRGGGGVLWPPKKAGFRLPFLIPGAGAGAGAFLISSLSTHGWPKDAHYMPIWTYYFVCHQCSKGLSKQPLQMSLCSAVL